MVFKNVDIAYFPNELISIFCNHFGKVSRPVNIDKGFSIEPYVT